MFPNVYPLIHSNSLIVLVRFYLSFPRDFAKQGKYLNMYIYMLIISAKISTVFMRIL